MTPSTPPLPPRCTPPLSRVLLPGLLSRVLSPGTLSRVLLSRVLSPGTLPDRPAGGGR